MTTITLNSADLTSFGAQKILLVERHLMVAGAMVAYMQEDLGAHFSVVQSLPDALEEIKKNGNFSLILVDINSCLEIGRSEIEQLIRSNGASTVALIADFALQNKIRGLIELEICGVILKSMPARSVSNIIQFMLNGESFFPPSLVNASEPIKSEGEGIFTNCESEVLGLLEQGYSNRQISQTIKKSEATVKMHLSALFRKLQATNRTTAVINARKLKAI